MYNNYCKFVVNLTWTEEEKVQLLAALQKYGAGNLGAIASEVKSRSVNEIRIAIGLYERVAIRAIKTDPAKPGEFRKAAIDRWIAFLKRTQINNRATKDVVAALKFIALYEKNTEIKDIILRDCYEYIATLAVGKSPKKLTDESEFFVMSSLAHFSTFLQRENLTTKLYHLSKLNLRTVLQKLYVNKKGSAARDPGINVLKIPMNLLKLYASYKFRYNPCSTKYSLK